MQATTQHRATPATIAELRARAFHARQCENLPDAFELERCAAGLLRDLTLAAQRSQLTAEEL